ncbi:MAG: hypothetical protein MRY74_16825 [Neomegalonema sp.]|nr:hypothetical protein [Neomegalonema sp.]
MQPDRRIKQSAKTLLACALSAAWPACAMAEPVRVGAGEHGDYSRVVLNVTPPAGWRARSTTKGVEITLPTVADPFLAAAVTERRRAHRVATFTVRREGRASIIKMGFNCDCSARVYELGGRALIVDVSNNAPKPAKKAESAEGKTTAKPVPAPTSEPKKEPKTPGADDPVMRARAKLLEHLKKAEEQGLLKFKDGSKLARAAELKPRKKIETADPAPKPREKAAVEKPKPTKAPTPDATRRAAPDAKHAAKPTAEHAEHPDKPATPPMGAPKPAKAKPAKDGVTLDPAPKAEVEKGPDKPPLAAIEAAVSDAKAATPAPKPAPMKPCLPDKKLDVAKWRTDGDFYETLAARRGGVYDELARVDPDGVLKLARHYLSAGLGYEAAGTPASFGVDTKDAKIIAAMGRVIEGEPPTYGSPFARAKPCPGLHGLWQAAALAEIDPPRAAEAFALTRNALARTPEPIRRMLGARIGRALAASGAFDDARAVLKLLERAYDEPTDEMRLLEAEVAAHEGRDIAARAALRMVADGRGPLRAVALVRLSEMMRAPADRLRVSSLATRLSDAAMSWRGEEYGQALAAAEAKLRARFGDLIGAVDAIDRLQARIETRSERLDALRGALIETEIAAVSRGGKRIAAAVEVVRRTPMSAEGVRLRLKLAEELIKVGSAHLTPLLIDAKLQAADPRAAAIALRAAAAADLVGAPKRYADKSKSKAPRAGGPIETADAPKPVDTAADVAFAALRDRAFAAYLGPAKGRAPVIAELKASKHPGAKPLLTLLAADPDAPALPKKTLLDTPSAIGGGEKLLKDLDAEIKMMKELATDG